MTRAEINKLLTLANQELRAQGFNPTPAEIEAMTRTGPQLAQLVTAPTSGAASDKSWALKQAVALAVAPVGGSA